MFYFLLLGNVKRKENSTDLKFRRKQSQTQNPAKGKKEKKEKKE